jgi:Zn-dependent peptidase ImmA (M78 family)
MRPRRPRYARILREVNDLLSRGSIDRPPVPVERLAKLLGAKVVAADFNNEVSGVLVRKTKETIIGFAKEQTKTRQRFTIAHEIGHLMLHDAEEVHVDREFRVRLRSQASSAAADVDEIEANAFAACLLIPEHFIREDLKSLSIDFDDASQMNALAKRYQVSSQAMTFRLLNLVGN